MGTNLFLSLGGGFGDSLTFTEYEEAFLEFWHRALTHDMINIKNNKSELNYVLKRRKCYIDKIYI